MISRKTWLALVPGVLFCLLLAFPTPSQEKAQKPESISQLIRQLGDEDFQVREQTTLKLKQREHALPALYDAWDAEDAEVRSRIGTIVDHILGKKAEITLQELQQGKAEFVFDKFIDQMVIGKSGVKESVWPVALKYAQKLTDEVARKAGKEFKFPPENYAAFPVAALDRQLNGQICCQGLLTGSVSADSNMAKCFVLSRDAVGVEGILIQSVLLSSGPVKVPGSAAYCFIFCDGNVTLGTVQNCVIVATGSVTISSFLDSSVILAAGTVSQEIPGEGNKVFANAPINLPSFRQFDLKEVGVEVVPAVAPGWVFVQKVHAHSAFAKAGLKAGDVAAPAVQENIPTCVQDFRSRVRGAWLSEEPLPLVVRRYGKVFTVMVHFS